MPRGGARVNSGPPPDPNALRRERDRAPQAGKDGWVALPADGRAGAAPKWPFEMSLPGELRLWHDLWGTPQAAEWDRLGYAREIAMYARLMIAAESGNVSAATEARQWSDRLGLNPAALLRNRWRIGAAGAEPAKAAPKKRAARSSSRDRLRVVSDA